MVDAIGFYSLQSYLFPLEKHMPFINDQDDPKAIHAGPISAILILIQNRSHLNNILCPKFKELSSNNAITANILDLLYNPEYEDYLQHVIHHLHASHHSGGEALRRAVQTTDELSPHNRLRSIEYINHILQGDIQLITEITPFIADTHHAHKLTNWYLQDATLQELRKITPIEYPQTLEKIKLYSMYTTEADFEAYQQAHSIKRHESNYHNHAYCHDHHKHNCCDRNCCVIDLGWFSDLGKSILFAFNREPEQTTAQPEAPKPKSSYGCSIQ